MRLGIILLVATTLLPGCEVNLNHEGLTTRELKSFKVTGQAELVLDTFDGAIELHSWDKNEIEVEVEKRAMEQVLLDEIKVDAQQQGDKITIKVTGPSRMEHRGVTIGVNISPTARLRVAVPRNININATSGDGSIRAEAIDGRLVLNTTDGSVTGTRIGAVLRARTGDGSIRANIEPDTLMAENWELTTSDGSVTVTLPGAFSAEIDAETSDGTVRTNHPLLTDDREERREGDDREERRERRRTLKSKIGDGGKMFRIRTGDGTIRIER